MEKKEIDILYKKESNINGFLYKYDKDTINLLKKNFNRPDSLYIIAKENDKFVGFISIDSDWWEKNCFFIREIFVNPIFQNH